MKKKTKKIVIAAAVVVVAAVAIVTFTTISANAGQSAADTNYSMDVATKGDISKTVSGSGNLGTAKTLNVTADSHLDIDEMLVSAGDTLEAGQPVATLNVKAMQDYADDLQSQIDTTQTQIDTTNSTTTNLSIKTPVDGWVKNVELDEDDNIQDAMSQYGYVALVATEEREIISAAGSSLAEGDTVKVKCQGHTYNGTVTNENGALYVSIDTITRTVGADADVYDASGNKLFTGKIELAAYQSIDSSYGTVTDVKVGENDEVSAGDTIYSAEQYSQDVTALYASLDDLKSELATVQSLIKAGQLTTPVAGVLDTLNLAAGQSIDEGASLMTIDSTDKWIATVSVDELDISSIKVGQDVSVSLDSMPSDTFKGSVTRISDLGSASNGITTYDVDVSIDGNENFKLGMSVSCEITSEEAKGAVLVPVDDVLTTNNHSYVMVAVERSDADKAAIKQMIDNKDYTGLAQYMGEDASSLNIRMLPNPSQLLYSEVRAVETGIEDAYNIEIKSGLSEGENIIKQSSSSSNSSSLSKEGFFISGMGMPGGGTVKIPDGGNFPRQNSNRTNGN